MTEPAFAWLQPRHGAADQPCRTNPLTMELYHALNDAYATFVRRHPGEFSFADVSPALMGFMAYAYRRMYRFPLWTIKDDVTWKGFCEATVQSLADGLRQEGEQR
jgi:hypothetical protein